MSFTIGSLFDGSGGFPLAATMCGGIPKWSSEIEPYPIAVTKSRFPGIKHLGSVTDIKGGKIEPVDVITFGSPCQDLSVAGKRAGLKHEANGDDETTRSGLFMEAVRIIKEMREKTNGVYPRFALWENVPGAFSSNKGEDFRIVLEELIKVVEPSAVMPPVPEKGWPYADSYCGDGWSLAYRVLDAQFWGVPQRRRRIYLVADFRGECAGKVSFEREGLRGYFETSRTPWQTVAGNAEDGSGTADCEGAIDVPICFEPGAASRLGGYCYEDKCGTLRATMGDNQFAVAMVDSIGGQAERGWEGETAPCLKATHYKFAPVVSYPDAVGVDAYNQTLTGNKAKTINSAASDADHVPCVLESAGFCPEQSAKTRGIGFEEEVAPTLRAGVVPGLVYSVENHPADSRVNLDESGKVQTLTSRMGTGGGKVPMVMESKAIYTHPQNDTWEFEKENRVQTLSASMGMGGGNTPLVMERNPVVEPVYCLQGNGIDRADTAGCNGKGVKEDISYTLNTIDRPAVAYSMKTIARNGKALVEQANPICASDYKDPDIVAYKDAVSMLGDKVSGTLMARDYKGIGRYDTLGSAVCIPTSVRYIVRRLTPTECARLQGFPDTWGHPTQKTELTDEEHQFWLNVRNTHAAINDKATKEYTKEQMLKWYNSLHTDSNEYKMWGNGIALPNALYVMQGIADVMSEEKNARKKWLDDLLK